jgi:hypothetical protein
MIPLPGASFVYSLLKDIWSWLTGLRGRRLLPALFQSTVASTKGWTVDHWHHPVEAFLKFGDQDWLRDRKEAEKERDKAEAERRKGVTIGDRRISPYWSLGVPQTPEEAEARKCFSSLEQRYTDAQRKVDFLAKMINEDLTEQLARGELMARGFRAPFSHGAPYLTISRHEWRIIKLDAPTDRAEGGGVSYVGLTIGKAGTKSFLRRANS